MTSTHSYAAAYVRNYRRISKLVFSVIRVEYLFVLLCQILVEDEEIPLESAIGEVVSRIDERMNRRRLG